MIDDALNQIFSSGTNWCPSNSALLASQLASCYFIQNASSTAIVLFDKSFKKSWGTEWRNKVSTFLPSFQHFVFCFYDYPDLILNKLEEFSTFHVCTRNEILQTLQEKNFSRQKQEYCVSFLWLARLFGLIVQSNSTSIEQKLIGNQSNRMNVMLWHRRVQQRQ